jgi:hypothetical protein
MDYKKKALKYKYKYETLLKQLKSRGYQVGGFDKDQFLVFENELKTIYSLVSGYFDSDDNEYISLTGSGALAYIVNKLGMEEELKQMDVPNDLDIVYYIGRKTDPSQVEQIGDYVVQEGQRTLTSRTYNLKDELSEGKQILNFDMTNMKSSSHPEFIEIEDSIGGRTISINILNLNKLKILYEDSETEEESSKVKVQSRIQLIDRIINHIRTSGDPELLHKYKLDLGVSSRRGSSTRPVSSFSRLLEDSDEEVEEVEEVNDEEDFGGQFKLKSAVFESDEEEDLPLSRFGKTNSSSGTPFKRPDYERSSPEYSSRRGLNFDYKSGRETRDYGKSGEFGARGTSGSSGSSGFSETLAGITELEESVMSPKLVFKPTNRHLFIGIDEEEGNVAETLDGISELEPRKKSQEQTNLGSDETLAGISEVETRRFRQKDIKLPPIRPN